MHNIRDHREGQVCSQLCESTKSMNLPQDTAKEELPKNKVLSLLRGSSTRS